MMKRWYARWKATRQHHSAIEEAMHARSIENAVARQHEKYAWFMLTKGDK